jgi:hypothetical protein
MLDFNSDHPAGASTHGERMNVVRSSATRCG